MIESSKRPIRMLITSGELSAENFHSKSSQLIETIRRAANAGIELVQIREKRLPGKMLFQVAAGAMHAIKGTTSKVVLNERFDVALAARMDGVHLTSTSIPADNVRRLAPKGFLIGVSTHLLSEVVVARDARADYVLYGPVFATPEKGDPAGLGKLNEVCSAVNGFPVIAVGGIAEDNVESALASGASGFAAIRYLNDFVNMAE